MSQNELLNLVEENAALVLLRNVRRKGSATTLLSKVGGEDPIVHKHSLFWCSNITCPRQSHTVVQLCPLISELSLS